MTLIGILGAPSDYGGAIVAPFGTIEFTIISTTDFLGNLDFVLNVYTQMNVTLEIDTGISL